LRRYGFGSTAAQTTGAIVYAGNTHTLSATEKQNLFQRLYEFGTHRGDVFDQPDHSTASNIDASTYARLITASFVLADNVLTVTV
jgi:hypothetical protein